MTRMRELAGRNHLRRACTTTAIVCALALAPTALADVDTNVAIERLGGATRYDTMAQLSERGYDQSEWACVATGENFPDALAASSLAGVYDAPILLTEPDELSYQAMLELERLGVHDVWILGGPDAIDPSVTEAIEYLGITCHHAAGKDRYATALEIMRETREAGSDSDTIIIATGAGFADSLSIGPWAYVKQAPIVLAKNGTLTRDTVKAIKEDKHVKHILIVGGSAVVDDKVMDQLGSGYRYSRIAGPDRYRTSAAIALWECTGDLDWSTCAIATGNNFPDALAGAALMGSTGSPLLLVADDATAGLGVLAAKAPNVDELTVMGGTRAVSERSQALADWLLNSFRPTD